MGKNDEMFFKAEKLRVLKKSMLLGNGEREVRSVQRSCGDWSRPFFWKLSVKCSSSAGDPSRRWDMPVNLFLNLANTIRKAISLTGRAGSQCCWGDVHSAGETRKLLKAVLFFWRQPVGRPLHEGTRSIGVQDVPAPALCAGPVSRSSATNEIAAIKPECPRCVCCLCRVLRGWVRIEAKQMKQAGYVCVPHLPNGFVWKERCQKSLKQQHIAKVLNFLSLLQQIEISRTKKCCTDCCLFVMLLFSFIHVRGSLQAPRWQHQPVAPSGLAWSLPGLRCERCGHMRAMLWPVHAEMGPRGRSEDRKASAPVCFFSALFIVLQHCLVLSQYLCEELCRK